MPASIFLLFDPRTDGFTFGRTHGRTDPRTDRPTDGPTHGWTDPRMDRLMDGPTDGTFDFFVAVAVVIPASLTASGGFVVRKGEIERKKLVWLLLLLLWLLLLCQHFLFHVAMW